MLNKLCLIICLVFGFRLESNSQIIKEFKVEERNGFNLVHLDFNVYKGISEIQRSQAENPILIQCDLSKVNILPSFHHQTANGVLTTHLTHRNVESENLGKSLSYKLFSNSNDDFDHKWNVGLNSNFLYDLNFNFGIGKANFDFSHLPISNCKVNSTSADVALNYSKKMANSVKMDTLLVKINMGNLDASHLNFTNAKEMIFEANYGALNLSFSDKMPEACNIIATVGAGKIDLKLPDESQPFIIKLKSTAMCRTNVSKSLKDIGNKTYVSKSYKEDAENLMTFVIDVSVGSVTIK
ncbi:hypothetical protein A33Q_0406 [Indibacter alkaliphilus LW1]|uniref:Uncharacterized protein n=1 Tax=Indibacter alkaliphilus (strain CCUG 57479 / KCTC 22604 / LW1) TaxID=1189612 RepID=S2DR25_INDAL|nr:hypothetical protein [Indibacter alkaliphilus]EOZ99725.1 hypothetical protein A33Q_0406 [Indibacter alkaliphilus LW1]